MKGIVVGGIQYSAEDPFPAPVIAVDYATLDEAKQGARLLTTLQNGTCPLKMGEAKPVFMGDTNVKISFTRIGDSDEVLCEVFAKSDPRHLTYGFYAADKTTVDLVRAFRHLLEIHRSYTFTVAHDGRVMTGELDVVKYIVTERGVPS
ncbi:MAG: hypothetical protein ACM3WU_11745 [Bacillota bacterium]